ncbi:transposase, partial [Escherichia coli]|nr:transposase [Escherichia coli]
MPRLMLNNQHWKKLKPILQEIGIYDYSNLRKTVEGILYKMRTGIPWRDLPRYFGKTNTIFKAFNRWSQSNKLIKLFEKMINFPDMEW